jgi:molecular chaperone HscB
VSKAEDYFSVFGLSRQFALNRSEVEKRFYQLSRALHPDRFTAADLETKARSLARMSFINQAYGVLKSAENTRSYLIKLESNKSAAQDSKSNASIPMELTEAWFDLQELILEDPTSARSKVEEFKVELSEYNDVLEKKMSTLETTYDSNPSQLILDQLTQELQTQSYINSMEKDLERLKKNAYSN